MDSAQQSKHVLVCGHRAFAARGLRACLENDGHQVSEFSRGTIQGNHVEFFGPVTEVHQNPWLSPTYDVVVNFIVMKFESVGRNLEYFESLLRLCRERKVRYLIQISSMSVYQDFIPVFREDAPIRSDPERCGPYAASKLAAEQFLRAHAGNQIRLSLLRPAYILGEDMHDAIGSVGTRIRSRNVLVLGRSDRQRPVVSRQHVQLAISRLVPSAPRDRCEICLLVDRKSPTCFEYLQACCEILGLGTRAICYPAPLWIGKLFVLQVTSKTKPFSWSRFVNSVRERQMKQSYDPTWTEARLGLSLSTDFRRIFHNSAASIK